MRQLPPQLNANLYLPHDPDHAYAVNCICMHDRSCAVTQGAPSRSVACMLNRMRHRPYLLGLPSPEVSIAQAHCVSVRLGRRDGNVRLGRRAPGVGARDRLRHACHASALRRCARLMLRACGPCHGHVSHWPLSLNRTRAWPATRDPASVHAVFLRGSLLQGAD